MGVFATVQVLFLENWGGGVKISHQLKISHLVIDHLQLAVMLLQLRQLGQHLTAEVHVDEACRTELGQPRLLWAQAVESLCKSSGERKDNINGGKCLYFYVGSGIISSVNFQPLFFS